MTRPGAARAHPSQPSQPSDRGSISLFAVVITTALIIILGLVVDGGGKIQAQQRAQDAAREAARAGGQALQAAPAIRGEAVTIDPAEARTAAENYLAGANVTGTVTVQGGTVVVVDTTAEYTPLFLSIVGISTQTVHGQATARVVRAVGGAER